MHFNKTLFLLLFTIVLGVSAQDNYTVNIRYGRNAAALDSVITKQLEEDEEEGDLYEGLYGSWNNSAVNPYGMNIGNMKDSFYINIANYYPPVLGKVTSPFGPRGRRGFRTRRHRRPMRSRCSRDPWPARCARRRSRRTG